MTPQEISAAGGRWLRSSLGERGFFHNGRPACAPAGGAGEPANVTIPAAVANAVFDATSVRLRRLPLTAERVKAALA